MKNICDGLPWWGHVIVWIVLILWDFFIGKTKFRSAIGMVFEILKEFVSIVKRSKGDNQNEGRRDPGP